MRLVASMLVMAALAIAAGCTAEPKRAPVAPVAPTHRDAALRPPSNLSASDPCVTRWGKPCVTNLNNTYTGKFLLKWDYFENVPGIRFLVWATNRLGTDPHTWTLLTNTADKFYAMPATGVSMFFAVSATNPVLKTESDFAR